MTATPLTFQEAWIASLKTHSAVFNSGTNPARFPEEIREAEWQSTDFVYPNIRVSLDFVPDTTGCAPDKADVYIEVFSEEKSSKQAVTIASAVYTLYHKKAFTQNGIRFSTVEVKKVFKPERDVYAWMSKVHIYCEGK